MPMPVLDSLNDRQRRAVCYEGNEGAGVLVLAGAGTGKTRVLTCRIAWLMEERGVDARSILAVTFTNKAANEMRERVSGMIEPGGVKGAVMGTFHGVCNRILRRHAEVAGWADNFQIIDMQDQKSLIAKVISGMGAVPHDLSPVDFAKYINKEKEQGLRADQAASGADHVSKTLREVYVRYEKRCREENKMDFPELLLSCFELLRDNEELRNRYAARFAHVLIDEFQDTSPLQYKWLQRLNSGRNSFFAVGDDDQSIYAFRGADPSNIMNFQRDFRAPEIIRLEQNYRSTGSILRAANALIAFNKSRLGKNLFTEAGVGAPLDARIHASDQGEAHGIARAIRGQIDKGAKAADVAVLYRANGQSRLLEKAMRETGVPYRILGGTRFYERMEIKHALAYMRLADGDDADSMLRVVNMPPRGIGAKTLAALKERGLFTPSVSGAAQKAAPFFALLENLRAIRSQGGESMLPDLARAVVGDSGLLAHYESRPEDRERAENLHEFVSAASQYAEQFFGSGEAGDSGERNDSTDLETADDVLRAFLANASLEPGDASSDAGIGAVSLMTVHVAKGLEFPIVHIAGAEEGMFPHSMSLHPGNPSAVEEERRLMYVAITRARRELHMHCAQRRTIYGEARPMVRSRFLDELTWDAPGRDSHATGQPRDNLHQGRRPVSRPASPPPAVSGSGAEYRPGSSVHHPRYGKGVVLRCEKDEDGFRVEVAFKKEKKEFLTSIAPLKPA